MDLSTRLLFAGLFLLVAAVATFSFGFVLFPARNSYYFLELRGYALECFLSHLILPKSLPLLPEWRSCQSWLGEVGLSAAFLVRTYAVQVPAILGAAALVLGAITYAFKTPVLTRVVRGGRLYEYREADAKLRKTLKRSITKHGLGSDITDRVSLSAQHDFRHFLIRGGTGSGKTQLLLRLIMGWIDKGEAVVALDLKGSFTSTLGSLKGPTAPIILSPGDTRSHEWAIGYDCVDEDDAHELARHLIPDAEKNRFFSQSARNVLVAVILKLQLERPQQWSWRDLDQLTSLPLPALRQICEQYYPIARSVLDGDARQSSMDVLSTLSTNLVTVRMLAKAWPVGTRRFSMKKWILAKRKSSRVVILGWNEKKRAMSENWVAAFSSMLGSFCASPEMPESNKKTLNLALDEFGNLPKMTGLSSAINMGRSKGLCVALVTQDVGQLKQIYGQDSASGWLSTIGTQIVCRLGPGPSNEAVSKDIGQQEIEERQTSDSRGTNGGNTSIQWVKRTRPIISPNELLSRLKVDETGYSFLLYGLDENAYLLRSGFVHLPEIRKAYVPKKVCRANQRQTGEQKALRRKEPSPKQLNRSHRALETSKLRALAAAPRAKRGK